MPTPGETAATGGGNGSTGPESATGAASAGAAGGAVAPAAGTIGKPVSGSTDSVVVGNGIGGIASRSASISCESDAIRTFDSSTFSRTTRTTVARFSAVNCWSANARRMASPIASCPATSSFMRASSAFIIRWRRSACSCSIRMSAINCSCSRSAAPTVVGKARIAASVTPATRVKGRPMAVLREGVFDLLYSGR